MEKDCKSECLSYPIPLSLKPFDPFGHMLGSSSYGKNLAKEREVLTLLCRDGYINDNENMNSPPPSSIRQLSEPYNEELISKSRDYLDRWLNFAYLVETNRIEFYMAHILIFGWVDSTRESKFETSVFRFETIMTANLHAFSLYNAGNCIINSNLLLSKDEEKEEESENVIRGGVIVDDGGENDGLEFSKQFTIEEEEDDENGGEEKKSKKGIIKEEVDKIAAVYISKALQIFLYVCFPQIALWSTKRQNEIPFECTEDGCRFFIDLCLVKLLLMGQLKVQYPLQYSGVVQNEYDISNQKPSVHYKELHEYSLLLYKVSERMENTYQARYNNSPNSWNKPSFWKKDNFDPSDYTIFALVTMMICFMKGRTASSSSLRENNAISTLVLTIITNAFKQKRTTMQAAKSVALKIVGNSTEYINIKIGPLFNSQKHHQNAEAYLLPNTCIGRCLEIIKREAEHSSSQSNLFLVLGSTSQDLYDSLLGGDDKREFLKSIKNNFEPKICNTFFMDCGRTVFSSEEARKKLLNELRSIMKRDVF